MGDSMPSSPPSSLPFSSCFFFFILVIFSFDFCLASFSSLCPFHLSFTFLHLSLSCFLYWPSCLPFFSFDFYCCLCLCLSVLSFCLNHPLLPLSLFCFSTFPFLRSSFGSLYFDKSMCMCVFVHIWKTRVCISFTKMRNTFLLCSLPLALEPS